MYYEDMTSGFGFSGDETDSLKKNRLKNVAVILAGGTGTRFGSDIPKQFMCISGKTILEYTTERFECCNCIDEIALVVHRDYVSFVEEIRNRNQWTKVSKVMVGGAERHLSSVAAIEAYKDSPNVNLIFHDAARPLVSKEIISKVSQALLSHNAVAVAVPMTDTVFVTDQARLHVIGVYDRNKLMRAQTPQGFRYDIIAAAYSKALLDKDFVPTDDCSTLLKYLPDNEIFIVEGEQRNIKLTYNEDIPFVEYGLKYIE